MVVIERAASPSGSSTTRTKTAASPTMNVGTPHTLCDSTNRRVLLLDCRQRAPGVDLGPHGVDVGAGGGQHGRQLVAVPQVAGPGVAMLEELVVHVAEHVGLGVTHGQRRLQGEQPAVGLRALPHGCLSVLDVGLGQGEWQERDIPVGARPQPGEHVIVCDAGVRAAVVEGQSEGAGHGEGQRDSCLSAFPPAA